MKNKIRAAIFGHAIADALGVPVEFMDREELLDNPVNDYRGHGTHHVPAGTWSDDTSMTLASLDSLTQCVDYDDMMQRFCQWKRQAAYTATDEVFDMGIATNIALNRFLGGTPALQSGCSGEFDNGNGSLMRIIPAVLYCKYRLTNVGLEEHIKLIHDISSLTHAHPRSMIGCGVYYFVLMELLENASKSAVKRGLEKAQEFYNTNTEFKHYHRLVDSNIAELPINEIRSTGYVVSTLEAAIWCLMNTESYSECVLKAVNLGSDTDTVAAVAGGLAGVLYGMEGIPHKWYSGLIRHEQVETLCSQFCR